MPDHDFGELEDSRLVCLSVECRRLLPVSEVRWELEMHIGPMSGLFGLP